MGDGGPLNGGAGATRSRLRAALLGGLLAALFLGPLLDPATRIGPRDFAQFNLPLHAGFARLARFGLPEWNPELWGGQPVLSNPNYAPFYPPTWLVVVLEPAYALQLSVALHALLAAAGAALLVARLGGRASARWLAALAFGGGGWFLGLVHALRILFGIAWIPWVLVGARAVAAALPGAPRRRALLGLAAAVAALSFAGEPVSILLGVGAAGLALVASEGRSLAAAGRGVAAGALGIALAAVQLVPGLARFSDSARATGLAYERATLWSMPPERLVEVVYPRFYGEAAGLEDGVYFGWKVHDKKFPYLMLITPGLLLALLGGAGMLARALPWRRVWALGALAGLALALGRHNPAFQPLWTLVPGLSTIRYPEKFFLGTLICLVFAGALAWGRLLDQRERGNRGEADLPAALAGVCAAVAATLAILLRLEPRLGGWFATTRAPLEPGSELVGAAVQYLERQAWLAALFAAAIAGLLLATRCARLSSRALAVGAVALLGLDLWVYGHRILFRVPAETYQREPELARAASALPGRLWSTSEVAFQTETWVTRNRREFEYLRSRSERLDPLSGAIWGIRYALTADYDLTLTGPARRAAALFETCWRRKNQDLAYRFLGAWSVGKLAIVKGLPRLRRELGEGTVAPVLADLVPNPYYLPPYRFVIEAGWYDDPDAAGRAALAARLPVPQREFLLGVGPGSASFDPEARIVSVEERGDEVEVRYRASREALLVVASTFDAGWSARVGGRRRPIWETAAGMMAVALPAGERQLTLRYRDPWVRVGGGISAIAALAALWIALRARRVGAAAAP